MSPESRSNRARLANYKGRGYSDEDPKVIESKQAFTESRLADHINAVVDAWPPLRPDQIGRLAALLHGGDAA